MPHELRADAPGRISLHPHELRDPGAGCVRIRIDHCGICGSDLHYFTGRSAPPTVCPGHEMTGRVDAIGEGVTRWSTGDRVAIEPLERCRECDPCMAGNYQFCHRLDIFGVTRPGGFAQTVHAPEYTLYAIPDAIPEKVAALSEPLAVAVHALKLSGAARDEPLLILGAGSIGLLSVYAAKHLGFDSVTVTAKHSQQKRLAETVGADEIIAPGSPPSRAPVAAIETVGGHADTLDEGVNRVRPGGTVVVAGLFDDVPKFSAMVLLAKEVRIVGAMVYNRSGEKSDFQTAVDLLGRDTAALAELVTHEFGIEDAQQAFTTAADKATGAVKVLVHPN